VLKRDKNFYQHQVEQSRRRQTGWANQLGWSEVTAATSLQKGTNFERCLCCANVSTAPLFAIRFPPKILCPCSTGNNGGFHETSAKGEREFSETCLALSSRRPCQSPSQPSSRSARLSLQAGALSLQLPAVHRGSEWLAALALFAETPPPL
jgi:hypothetical protein